MIYAHRGLHNENIPENSMISFIKAKNKKIPIELDIRLLKDNKIVVFHDTNLKRMTSINKKIEECTYNEIKELKLLNTNYKIPLLNEVLKNINDEINILIEIKTKNKKIIKPLLKILKNYTNFKIQSFNKTILKELKKYYKVGLLSYKINNKFDFLVMPYYLINDLNFNKIKKPLYIWDLKKEDIKKYQKYTNIFIVDYN